jgi:hypothetical protein
VLGEGRHVEGGSAADLVDVYGDQDRAWSHDAVAAVPCCSCSAPELSLSKSGEMIASHQLKPLLAGSRSGRSRPRNREAYTRPSWSRLVVTREGTR